MPQKRRGRGAKGATSTRVKKGALPKEAEPRSLIVRLKINSARLGVEDASPTEVHPFTPPSSPPELPMAPGPQEELETRLKSAIQTLYTIQSNTHGYLGPETQRALVHNFKTLSQNLQDVSQTSQHVDKLLPPELIDYVDQGRNPDIYTREFVEHVQKGNKYLKGKSQAYADFRDQLAKDMVKQWPEMKEAVDRVLEGKGRGMADLQHTNGTATQPNQVSS